MLRIISLLLVCLLLPHTAIAEQPVQSDQKSLDRQVQSLKQQVLELNRELFILEEELLFPGNTQVAIFLSMDAGMLFDLDSVQCIIDDKELTNHLYTQRELKALRRGGVQQLYQGNLKTGEHELVAYFVGAGPQQRDYKRGAKLNFIKNLGPKYIELVIKDDPATQQPQFVVKEWE